MAFLAEGFFHPVLPKLVGRKGGEVFGLELGDYFKGKLSLLGQCLGLTTVV